MVKIPIELKKRLEQLNGVCDEVRMTLGQLELEKAAQIGRFQVAEKERFDYWLQICGEYAIDPSKGNYQIKDDGEVVFVGSDMPS